ncbi:MAG: hypothetical protein IT518_07675 [Burkholderiales bacterium]|nr:hypothetical protein [Burkholderiales bacterium]
MDSVAKRTRVQAALSKVVIAALLATMGIATGESQVGNASEAARRDLAAMQGRWNWNGSGATGPGDFAATRRFLGGGRSVVDIAKFDPDDYAVIVKGAEFRFGNGNPPGRATATLDPTRLPKWIDFKDSNNRVWIGVYRLDGDVLTIVVSNEQKRPKDAGTHHFGEGSIRLVRDGSARK